MSASVLERPARRELALEWIAVGAGIMLLLVRSSAVALPSAPVILLGLYACVAWVSLGVRTDPVTPRAVWPALLVGLVAVAAAAVVGGRPPPASRSTWAVPLALGAAVAEEAFFRGLLYSVLSRSGVAIAVIGAAVAFAALHVPGYGVSVFWVDLGAGLLLSWQRWASGGWAVPAATHVAANLLAVLR